MRARTLVVLALISCGAPIDQPDAGELPDVIDAGESADAGETIDAGMTVDAGQPDAGFDAGVPDSGVLVVDRTNPQLYRFQFTAKAADPDAGLALGQQVAALDTRVEPRGLLVVYLHGAGAPTTCGSVAHEDFLAVRGFHVIGPCYSSNYGVGNCGNDIGGCRLEAFDGMDRTSVIAITRSDSLEERIVRMLTHLQSLNPQGGWEFFIVDGHPRWDRIVISGISHGASTAALIARVRNVERAVMLSGPLDTNQNWLTSPTLTPVDRQWGFTHTGDGQHAGHLTAFNVLMLPGTPQRIENSARPWNDSHRLFTSVDAGNSDQSHASTQVGGSSPRSADGGYRFTPVWEALYGVD